MFAEERYMRIVEIVNEAGKATVADLSEMLRVSPVTVRRDLEKLEARRLLIRTHGGAIALHIDAVQAVAEKSFTEKEEALAAEKSNIAEAAAKLVQDGDSVLLTPGTTNMLLAKYLSRKQGLTIVTNAVNIAMHMCSATDFEVIILGGHLRRKSLGAVGSLAEEAISHFRVDKLFLGVDGFDLREGLTTPNGFEASVNRRMINIAREVIVVADRSKFGKVMFSHIAPVSSVHTVISDSKLNEEYGQLIREQGLRLILV